MKGPQGILPQVAILPGLSIEGRDEHFHDVTLLQQVGAAQKLRGKGIQETHHEFSHSKRWVEVQDLEYLLVTVPSTVVLLEAVKDVKMREGMKGLSFEVLRHSRHSPSQGL